MVSESQVLALKALVVGDRWDLYHNSATYKLKVDVLVSLVLALKETLVYEGEADAALKKAAQRYLEQDNLRGFKDLSVV